jgi:hypothetical protein
VDKIFKLSSEFLVSVSVRLLIVCFYERDFFYFGNHMTKMAIKLLDDAGFLVSYSTVTPF